MVRGRAIGPIRLQSLLHRSWALRGDAEPPAGAQGRLNASISRRRNEGCLAQGREDGPR